MKRLKNRNMSVQPTLICGFSVIPTKFPTGIAWGGEYLTKECCNSCVITDKNGKESFIKNL